LPTGAPLELADLAGEREALVEYLDDLPVDLVDLISDGREVHGVVNS
jgi:hypothetical protein